MKTITPRNLPLDAVLRVEQIGKPSHLQENRGIRYQHGSIRHRKGPSTTRGSRFDVAFEGSSSGAAYSGAGPVEP